MIQSKPFALAVCSAMLAASLSVNGCQATSPVHPTTHSTSNSARQASSSATSSALTQGLTLVEDNHFVMTIGSDKYVLDSFIVPFEQPYYILVRKQDGKAMIKHAAEVVALDYIKPRGCTEPLKRRADLDKQTADGSHYLIGVAC